MSTIDTKFKTIPKPVHTDEGIIPKPNTLSWKLFGIWAWSPVIAFQIGLTAFYLALVYFGISGLIASPPSFDTTVPEWYVGYWAVGLIVGGVTAAVGSVSRSKWFERGETLGSFLLTLTVGSYALIVLWLAYGTGDSDRIAGGAGFVALAIWPITRFMWLVSQLLRK